MGTTPNHTLSLQNWTLNSQSDSEYVTQFFKGTNETKVHSFTTLEIYTLWGGSKFFSFLVSEETDHQ